MTFPITETEPAKLVSALTNHVKAALVLIYWISATRAHFAVSFDPFHVT